MFRRPVVTVTGNEAVRREDYSSLGRVTEFNYGAHLGKGFTGGFPISNFRNFGKYQTQATPGNC
jgi:hypothetical protein